MDTTTKCVNGTLKAGDLVISTPDDDYPCLIGRVLKINLLGSPEHNEETDNDADDVHVDFFEYNYSKKRKKEIAKVFSGLYGTKKKFSECPIDDTIMSPECLIRITEIDEKVLKRLLRCGIDAVSYCYNVLSAQLPKAAPNCEDDDAQPDIIAHIFEVMDSSLAMAGYIIMDGDSKSLIIRHSQSDRDFEIRVDELG